MNKIISTLLLMFVAVASSFAQVAPGDTPPQPSEYGKCYAKCLTPDRYETVTRQVLVSGGDVRTTPIPAEYNNVSETVLVKEATTSFVSIPAKFETTEKRVLVKEGSCKVTYTAAQYKTNSTKTLKTPASGKWVRKPKAANCISENPEDCYVMCWEEVPAEYTYNTTRDLIVPEKWDTIYSDPVYETITVQTVKEPARYESREVPPVYKTITKQILAKCEGVTTTTTAPTYKTVSERVLVEKGGYTDWVEVVCDKDVNDNLIQSVQRVLKEQGYYRGSIDGVMGSGTKAALAKFQKEKGLPVGNLNIATLQALGLR